MPRSTLRRPLVAAALLAALVGPQATAAPRPAELAAGSYVADLSALPASAHGTGYVAAGSDALSPAALDSARAALTPGYLAAGLRRSGSALRATLVYDRGALGAAVVERTGTVSGDSVTFAPGGVVTALVASPTDALAATCPTCLAPYIVMTPSSQTVNGLGYPGGSYGYQVGINIEGSSYIPAGRDITIPFTTCSAIQCTTVSSVGPTTGTTWHGFAPLGCDQTQTVHGWIKYDTGWKYASVSVTIQNPSC
jgi:hypothetical protein